MPVDGRLDLCHVAGTGVQLPDPELIDILMGLLDDRERLGRVDHRLAGDPRLDAEPVRRPEGRDPAGVGVGPRLVAGEVLGVGERQGGGVGAAGLVLREEVEVPDAAPPALGEDLDRLLVPEQDLQRLPGDPAPLLNVLIGIAGEAEQDRLLVPGSLEGLGVLNELRDDPGPGHGLVELFDLHVQDI